MRKRFHIERQVQRLADSKTLEIIEGVLQKLANTRSIQSRPMSGEEFYKKQTSDYITTAYYKKDIHWQCDCTYCKLLILYTYLTMEYSRCERNGSRSRADDLYYEVLKLRNIRKEMELIPMTNLLKDHIKNAKMFIGKNISTLKFRATELRPQMDKLLNTAQYYIQGHRIAPKHPLSWF